MLIVAAQAFRLLKALILIVFVGLETIDLMVTHRNRHFSETKFTCHVCNQTILVTSHINSHMQTHMVPEGSQPLQSSSRRIRDKTKVLTCKECGQSFKGRAALTTHKLTHTGKSLFYCNICTKGFVNSHVLKRHEMIHSGELPFSCQVCGKRFHQKCSLQSHMWNHTGEKPYKCKQCEFSFLRREQLTRHVDKEHKTEVDK